MLPVTKRDFKIRRAAVRYMVRVVRECRSDHARINSENNLNTFYAQRHNYVFDHSPIPLPVRRWN
jgi:hypothetical protein